MDLSFSQIISIILATGFAALLIYGFYIVLVSKNENYKDSGKKTEEAAPVKIIETTPHITPEKMSSKRAVSNKKRFNRQMPSV